MKITKYQHACFVVEQKGEAVVVDPGIFSHDFIMPSKVVAIVITHEHPDHFSESLIISILKKHPHATLIAHESIAGRFTNYQTTAAKPGESFSVGSFTFTFFGGTHALIAPPFPVPANIAVLINNALYYPGDSFVAPGVPVQVLALPVSAPWLKISETMTFLSQVHPTLAFPTHDAILSPEGKEIVDRMVGTAASGQNTQYKRLDGLSIEL